VIWCLALWWAVTPLQAQEQTVVRGVVLDNAATARVIALRGEDGLDYAIVWDEQAVVRWLDGSPASFGAIQRDMPLQVTGTLERTPTSTVLRPAAVRILRTPEGMPQTGAASLPGWVVPVLLLLPVAARLVRPERTTDTGSEFIVRQRRQRTWC
jgi:hypothetical protein